MEETAVLLALIESRGLCSFPTAGSWADGSTGPTRLRLEAGPDSSVSTRFRFGAMVRDWPTLDNGAGGGGAAVLLALLEARGLRSVPTNWAGADDSSDPNRCRFGFGAVSTDSTRFRFGTMIRGWPTLDDGAGIEEGVLLVGLVKARSPRSCSSMVTTWPWADDLSTSTRFLLGTKTAAGLILGSCSFQAGLR